MNVKTGTDKFRAALRRIARHRPDLHHGDALVMHQIACKALGVPELCPHCSGNSIKHQDFCPLYAPKSLRNARQLYRRGAKSAANQTGK